MKKYLVRYHYNMFSNSNSETKRSVFIEIAESEVGEQKVKELCTADAVKFHKHLEGVIKMDIWVTEIISMQLL